MRIKNLPTSVHLALLEGDTQNVADEDDNNTGESHEQRPAKSRPRLATALCNSFRRSFKSFKTKETDDTKERIKAAAPRSEIRQQKHCTMLLVLEQLEQSKERALDLQVAIHHKTTTASDEYQKCIIQTDDETDEIIPVKASSIEHMRAEKKAIDLKREQFAKEAAEISKILDSNAERLEILRQERNEQATN
jgi:hypothetical protein